MKKIYFLCTGNSCRSQMAEGFGKNLLKDQAIVYSAGVVASGVNPRAIAVMSELGIDISGQESSVIDPNLVTNSDYVITLCGNARDKCPTIPPNVNHIHWDVEDPIYASGSEEDILKVFRKVRDDIQQRILNFKKLL